MVRMNDLPPGIFREAARRSIASQCKPLPADGVVRIYLPIQTVSVLNTREHWAPRAKRSREHRQTAHDAASRADGMTTLLRFEKPLTITLTRIAGRRGKRLDTDNNASSMKACRDGIADALGIDDGSDRLTWVYGQEKAADFGVRIEIAVTPVLNV